MMRHLTANLWLLLLTLLLCSVAYPLALLAIGQLPFLKAKADGSLLVDAKGEVVGSRLEAQAFEGDQYFWPRPSAASYKGNASGASNLSANNPDLRSQVESRLNRLGAILKYGPKGARPGKAIWPDVEEWFTKQKGLVGEWAEKNPELAKAWVADKLTQEYVDMWKATDQGKEWLKPKTKSELAALKAEDLAVDYLKFYSKRHPGSWPLMKMKVDEEIDPETQGKPKRLYVLHLESCKEIRTYFYPKWREAHPHEDLEPVPADMVTTSGSGLDPHITMKNALYQFDRVADEWTEKRKLPRDEVARRLHKLLAAHKHAPLGGLAGVDLVNVMELNLALSKADW